MTNSNEVQSKTYKRATESTHRFDISSTVYTTNTFMSNRVIYHRELAPKQHLHLVLNHQIRTAPTLQPCFGHFDCKLSAFFVPYSLIWTKWNDFIEQTIRDGSLVKKVPVMYESDLAQGLINVYGSSESGITDATADLVIKDTTTSPATVYYYTFRDFRKRNVITSLENLGYVVPRYIEKGAANTGDEMNALPLLAWTKLWYDFYKIQRPDSFPFEPDKATVLSSTQIGNILSRMKQESIAYPKSYLCHMETADAAGNTNFHQSSAANRPELDFLSGRSQSSVETTLSQNYVGSAGHTTALNTTTAAAPNNAQGQAAKGGSPSLPTEQTTSTATSMKWLSEQNLQQLAKMTDYVKRLSVAGFSALKRMFAEYGIDVKDVPTNKTAQYIADYTFQINLQEVTATDSSNLGQQTGASLKSRGNSLVVDLCPDVFGSLIITMNIRPKVEFLRGLPRNVKAHLKPFDFFHPDFDGFGYQGTRIDEVHSQTDPCAGGTTATDAYVKTNRGACQGAIPTYGEYKVGLSLASGDFARKTVQGTYNQFHTGRTINESVSALPLSDQLMNQLSQWSSPEDFLRIFGNYTVDPFLCHLDFEGYIDAPMRPLFDLPGEWNTNGVSAKMNGDERSHM